MTMGITNSRIVINYTMSTPQALEVNWDPDTSISTVNVNKIRGIYLRTVPVRDVLIWNGNVTTTTGGNFSVNLTSDGTTTGPALFSDIYSTSATHYANTTATNACFAMLRGYGTALKTATFLAVRGIGTAGATGQVFQVTVIGSPL